MLNPETIERFFEHQRRDLEIRAQEIALRQQQLEIDRLEKVNAHEYAKIALDAQLLDRERERQAGRATGRLGGMFMVSLLITLGAFMILALWLNKDTLLMEIVRSVTLVLGGGGVGYGIGRNRAAPSKDQG